MFGILKGKKTYIVATLTVIGAVASFLTGDTSLSDSIQLVVTALLGTTLRAGIK